MSEIDGESAGGGADAAPRISVIVPTYNRAEDLRLTLESLCGQTLPVDQYEVVVADDGSRDGTRSIVESFAGRLWFKYHFQKDLGAPAGPVRDNGVTRVRNAGARLATAPLLVFLDCATLAGPDLLAAHLRAHTPPAVPGRAVAGYVYGYPPRKTDDPDYRCPPGLAAAVRTLTPQQVVDRYRDEPGFRDPRHGEFEKVGFDLRNRIFPEELFWSSNCSVPAADFWAVGGFDEDFRGWGLDDVDLGYRLIRNGTGIHLSLDAWAIESPHERDGAVNLAGFHRNARSFFDKYQFAEPPLELGWLVMQSPGGPALATLETLNRQVADWTRQCAGLTVAAELAHAFEPIAPHERVAVFGAGAVVPAVTQSCVLADFDRQVVDRLLADGAGARHDVRHNLGIQTALPDKAVDTVVITSRLDGLWSAFGSAILAEAQRIGTRVPVLTANRRHG
ncbi:glycosyltransferase [Plantactinospora sp. KLBMP9567]|uniref:glycosyltransferase n=1 Tax=Plantactinospora sp. KLBMP9567 TaxID=3085900 RepID=UPI002982AEBF|nr:glycosyltransferase [Plantactinospora sp. KLBMP9567]MDW5328810.1 glycosyltransferase [Plantactinospora sp. KLBMP9567]